MTTKHETDVKNHNFEIPTRQKTDELFRTVTPLGAGALVNLGVKLVQGYAVVSFFAVSDAPFEIRVFESCSPDGPFTENVTIAAALAGGQFVACARVQPCGPYMTVYAASTGGAQTLLELCGLGIPVA
jgi:hypothetical protein